MVAARGCWWRMSPWSSTVTSIPARPSKRPIMSPTGPPPATMILSSFAMQLLSQLEFAVDLDRDAVRELGEPDRGTGMFPVLRPEQLVEEIRRAVDHLRHAVEAGGRVDHSKQSHHPLHAVEVAELLLEAREHGEGNRARGGISLLDAQVAPNLAGVLDVGE